MTPKPLSERFWPKVQKSDGCWEWIGGYSSNGYGSIKVGDTITSAHKASYLLNVGPIPNGLFVLHRCDNRKCVNPIHLFLGTNKDNMEDCKSKGRTRNGNSNKAVCKHGHAFTEENTYLYPNGRRQCKACHRQHAQDRRLKIKFRRSTRFTPTIQTLPTPPIPLK